MPGRVILPDGLLRSAADQAKRRGQTVSDWVRDVVEAALRLARALDALEQKDVLFPHLEADLIAEARLTGGIRTPLERRRGDRRA